VEIIEDATMTLQDYRFFSTRRELDVTAENLIRLSSNGSRRSR